MAKRTIKIYYNTVNRRIFGEDGNEYANSNTPFLYTSEDVDVDLQITNVDGIPNVANPTDFYTGFTGDTITPSATIDNNYDWFYTGTLAEALTAIPIISVDITFVPSDTQSVNPTGVLYLVNSAGDSDAIDYTEVSVVGTTYTFTVDHALLHAYSIGDVASIAEAPLAASSNITTTDKDTGKFIITICGDSLRWFETISGTQEILDSAFEFLVKDATTSVIFRADFKLRALNIRDYSGVLPAPVPGGSVLDNYVVRIPYTITNPPQSLLNIDGNNITYDQLIRLVFTLAEQCNELP